MTEEIQHKCTVSWGMVYGENVGEYIDSLIDKKKKEVRQSLMRCGYLVKDQYFSHDCEWGTLYTWAELIDNPENICGSNEDGDIEMGYFYDEEKQRKYLNVRKMNKKLNSKKE